MVRFMAGLGLVDLSTCRPSPIVNKKDPVRVRVMVSVWLGLGLG